MNNENKVYDFNQANYQELCREYRKLLTLEKELADKKGKLRRELIDQAGGDRMEYGIKITFGKAKGSIDYKTLAESLYPEEVHAKVFEPYRKAEREVITIRGY